MNNIALIDLDFSFSIAEKESQELYELAAYGGERVKFSRQAFEFNEHFCFVFLR